MDAQLSLSLESDARHESALRHAWRLSDLRLPFHVALQDRALGICLRCFAEAMTRRSRRDRGEARATPPCS